MKIYIRSLKGVGHNLLQGIHQFTRTCHYKSVHQHLYRHVIINLHRHSFEGTGTNISMALSSKDRVLAQVQTTALLSTAKTRHVHRYTCCTRSIPLSCKMQGTCEGTNSGIALFVQYKACAQVQTVALLSNARHAHRYKHHC
jgi:hypothetical protein